VTFSPLTHLQTVPGHLRGHLEPIAQGGSLGIRGAGRGKGVISAPDQGKTFGVNFSTSLASTVSLSLGLPKRSPKIQKQLQGEEMS
jgi:hypothetical protein